jgi:hypothetical protein
MHYNTKQKNSEQKNAEWGDMPNGAICRKGASETVRAAPTFFCSF